MKNLFILLLLVLAAGCTQDTSELKNNVLKAYNSDAPQGAKATDLMIIQKKGNEYVGLLTTENDMQLMLSVFSDGKEFFYWVTNGAINPGTQQMQGVAEEVSMENFPEELIGDWNYDCDGEYAMYTRFSIQKSQGSFYVEGKYETDGYYGRITNIRLENNVYILNADLEAEGTPYNEDIEVKIINGKLIRNNDQPRERCR